MHPPSLQDLQACPHITIQRLFWYVAPIRSFIFIQQKNVEASSYLPNFFRVPTGYVVRYSPLLLLVLVFIGLEPVTAYSVVGRGRGGEVLILIGWYEVA
jgi:hypothetical protein